MLIAIAEGADWKTAGIPGGNTVAVCHDIRTYYEEAALELVNGPLLGPRAFETWFFEATEAGKIVLAARQAIRESGAKMPVWFYMAQFRIDGRRRDRITSPLGYRPLGAPSRVRPVTAEFRRVG